MGLYKPHKFGFRAGTNTNDPLWTYFDCYSLERPQHGRLLPCAALGTPKGSLSMEWRNKKVSVASDARGQERQGGLQETSTLVSLFTCFGSVYTLMDF